MPDSESVAAASNDMERGESSGVIDIGSFDDFELATSLLLFTLPLILNMSTAADIVMRSLCLKYSDNRIL